MHPVTHPLCLVTRIPGAMRLHFWDVLKNVYGRRHLFYADTPADLDEIRTAPKKDACYVVDPLLVSPDQWLHNGEPPGEGSSPVMAGITFLREPVGRSLASLGSPDPVTSRRWFRDEMADPDWVAGQAVTWQWENTQTRILSGVGASLRPGQCGRRHLESAKLNLLNNLTAFGLADQFVDSLLLISKTLGWEESRSLPPSLELAAETASALESAGCSRQSLDRIREVNELDLELYDFAREVFQLRLDSRAAEIAEARARLAQCPPRPRGLEHALGVGRAMQALADSMITRVRSFTASW